MNRKLVEDYINSQPTKVVDYLNLSKNEISYKDITGPQITEIRGDEEITRAYIITKLVNELGYSPDRIEIEHIYTAGRPHTNTSRIDIIVRDAAGDAFLFIEVKSPDEYHASDIDKTIEEQLYKVSFMEKAEHHDVKYLVLYTIAELSGKISDECIIIDTETYPTYADWEAERNCTNDLPVRYGKAQKTPYVKGSAKDLETNFTNEMLNQLQTDLHNVLWGGGGTDDNEVFSSLTNLILAKIQDEGEKDNGHIYDFQSMTFEKDGDEEFETNEQLFDRINKLYRRALREKLYILDESELKKSYVIDTKKFSLSKLKYAVQKLEGLSFVDGKNSLNGKDILGDFFEGIIRNGFKQSKGQFFTHINIVKFMLYAMQIDKLAIKRIKEDKEIPYMIDPSAGSGTFLIEYMKFITENMKYRNRNSNGYNADLGSSRDVFDKVDEWFGKDNRENRWAYTYIYGAEINFNLGTATKVNMILHGDGSTNIFVKDGLLPFTKYEKVSSHNVLHDSHKDTLYYDKDVNERFDLILTNPPFSVELDNDTKRTVTKGFVFGDKKNSENLFVERWYQLLRENGRLAAVLPESVFDTTENKYIRLFLYKYFKIKAVISLPQSTFEPFTSTKTSILFAQKKTSTEIVEWNSAWNDAANEYSKLRTRVQNLKAVYDGTKEKSKLPSIKNMTESEERETICKMLISYLAESDNKLSTKQLIDKYYDELEELCTYDKDTVETFGYVNTWWVFNEVAKKLNYDLFMAEIDNIGYKRSKRGEKETINELFDLEYAPEVLDVQDIKDDYMCKISDFDSLILREKERKTKEKKAEKIAQIDEKISMFTSMKKEIEEESKYINSFIDTYYNGDLLKNEYKERTDEKLINEFKIGKLRKYRSERVALHETTYQTILDYMRDIVWE